MTTDAVAKLVAMANQIATAFEGQHGDAVADTADHIRMFWPRLMRDSIVRHLASGGEGLSPTARAAVGEMAASHPAVGPPA